VEDLPENGCRADLSRNSLAEDFILLHTGADVPKRIMMKKDARFAVAPSKKIFSQ